MERGLVTLEVNSRENSVENQRSPKPMQLEEDTLPTPKVERQSSIDDETKNAIRLQVEKQYKEKYEKLVKSLEDKNKELKALFESVNGTLGTLQSSYDEFIKTQQSENESVVIDLVLESTYKVLGQKGVNEEYVKRVVSKKIQQNADGKAFRIKASRTIYELLKNVLEEKYFADEIVIADSKLNEGQLVFEGSSSVNEIGLLDRLEIVKTNLIDELGKNVAVSEI